MSFYDVIQSYRWEEIAGEIASRSEVDVQRALAARNPGLDDLLSLVAPSAGPYLEEIARRAHRLTVQRFGRVMTMFAPLYLSNVCTNRCVYCGFNSANAVDRVTLSPEDAEQEGLSLRRLGFRSILLLTGEAPNIVTEEYFKQVLEKLRPHFTSIGIEMFPMTTERYCELICQGVDSLTVFQETYDEARYGEFHRGGKKSDYRWRLETAERGGAAGFRRLGIGPLLGLSDWRVEGFFVALHAQYLLRHCWKSQIAISFPRLRLLAGGFVPPVPAADRDLVQLLCALRIVLPDAGFTLSTRETPVLRDHLMPLGITTISAGSHTEPGGYARPSQGAAQFPVADERSPAMVAGVLQRLGYEPVWKEWDAALCS
jgi:2-iminoacetate synthase